jgi:hypothetical protein
MKRVVAHLIVIAACVLTAQSALAQSDLGLKRVGAQLGLVDPENASSTLGLGVFVDHGTLAPRIKLASHLDYWGKSEDIPFGGTARVRDIALSCRARYMFPVSSPRVQPYAGGGLGLHFLNGKIEIPDQVIMGTLVPGSTSSSSDTKLGLDIGGGIEAPINPKTNFLAELWFGIVSDVNTVSLKVGLAHVLGH